MQSRQQNGSAASRRSGVETEPTTTPMASQPASPATPPHKRKKSGGFLALLGCCGSPREAATDGSEENVHKLDRLPNQRPATAKSKAHTPADQQAVNNAKTQLDEKEAVSQTKEELLKDKRLSNSSTQAQAAAGGERQDEEPKQATAPAPSVYVQPPNSGPAPDSQPAQHVSSEKGEDEEGDIKMGEVDGSGQQPEGAEQKEGDLQKPHEASLDEPTEQAVSEIPPPPPGPGPSGNGSTAQAADAAVIAPETPQQKFLLPPVLPEHAGRKCLVLDLDETLVHSSFKVCGPFPPPFSRVAQRINRGTPVTPPSRLHHSGRDRR